MPVSDMGARKPLLNGEILPLQELSAKSDPYPVGVYPRGDRRCPRSLIRSHARADGLHDRSPIPTGGVSQGSFRVPSGAFSPEVSGHRSARVGGVMSGCSQPQKPDASSASRRAAPPHVRKRTPSVDLTVTWRRYSMAVCTTRQGHAARGMRAALRALIDGG